jgi:hypothetical protein
LVELGAAKWAKTIANPTRKAPTMKNRIRLSALIVNLLTDMAAKLKINLKQPNGLSENTDIGIIVILLILLHLKYGLCNISWRGLIFVNISSLCHLAGM